MGRADQEELWQGETGYDYFVFWTGYVINHDWIIILIRENRDQTSQVQKIVL